MLYIYIQLKCYQYAQITFSHLVLLFLLHHKHYLCYQIFESVNNFINSFLRFILFKLKVEHLRHFDYNGLG